MELNDCDFFYLLSVFKYFMKRKSLEYLIE